MSVKKKTPQRQCVGCGEMKNKRDMIRILKTAEGEIVLDATGKKNGRGAYLCFDRECLEKAIKSRGLERSFKMCTYYDVPFYIWGRKEELGAAIGREYRASLALTDAGFRDVWIKQVKSM